MYRGGAEQKIRKYLVDNNYVDAVIQLPVDLFFGTNIGTCILVLKKSKSNNDVIFIDASSEFTRVSTKNRLQKDHQDLILSTLEARRPIDHFASIIKNDEIAQKDYLLSVSSYVETKDTSVEIDITALNAEIVEIVANQNALRLEIDRLVHELESAK